MMANHAHQILLITNVKMEIVNTTDMKMEEIIMFALQLLQSSRQIYLPQGHVAELLPI